MSVIFLLFFVKNRRNFDTWYFVSKLACFFEKANISGLFFSPDCRKFKDFFNFFSAIYKVNPAIPLCRTGVGWTPGSNGRIAVSQDKNEHFFEKTGKKSAPSDISKKPKNKPSDISKKCELLHSRRPYARRIYLFTRRPAERISGCKAKKQAKNAGNRHQNNGMSHPG